MLLALAGCAGPDLKIHADPSAYMPAMNSTVGIGLEPEATLIGPPKALIHWHASFGHFVRWDAPDYQVRELGADTTSGFERIYWTFDPAAIRPGKRSAEIVATIQDARTEKPIVRRKVKIVWEGDTAKVAPSRSAFSAPISQEPGSRRGP